MQDDPTLRIDRFGPDVLTDAELISFLLTRGGAPGEQAVLRARSLVELGSGLSGLATLCEEQLCSVSGVGPAYARRLAVVWALARRLSERPVPRGAVCDSPRQVYESLRGRLGRASQESLWVLLLDSRLRSIKHLEIGRGAANAVAVTSREVFGPALRRGASALILVHNHPSGDPTPSAEDIAMTERLHHAGELLGVRIHDHVIIGDGRFSSLAEMGHVPTAPVGFQLVGGRSPHDPAAMASP